MITNAKGHFEMSLNLCFGVLATCRSEYLDVNKDMKNF